MHESPDSEKEHLPPVSIVIPCLNRGRYLPGTIDSILKQDYPDIECIVIDGGSTDDTVEILKGYGDRIIWVSEPDDGHADAINKGWWRSRGDILAWLNADDRYVVPDAVSTAVRYFIDNPGVDVVYGDYRGISDDGEITSDVIKAREWDMTYAVKYCTPIITQPTSFMRRAILEKVGWVDPKCHGMDSDLWLRIGLAGTIRYFPFQFCYVRRGRGMSQEFCMSESKVRLTEKFFSTPDIPEPFNKPSFRRRAMSNANLTAAIVHWNSTRSIGQTLRYLFRAVGEDPLNSLYIGYVFPLYMLFYHMPLAWQEKIRGRHWYGIHGVSGGPKSGS